MSTDYFEQVEKVSATGVAPASVAPARSLEVVPPSYEKIAQLVREVADEIKAPAAEVAEWTAKGYRKRVVAEEPIMIDATGTANIPLGAYRQRLKLMMNVETTGTGGFTLAKREFNGRWVLVDVATREGRKVMLDGERLVAAHQMPEGSETLEWSKDGKYVEQMSVAKPVVEWVTVWMDASGNEDLVRDGDGKPVTVPTVKVEQKLDPNVAALTEAVRAMAGGPAAGGGAMEPRPGAVPKRS